jgi:hypothetical protein
MSASRVDDNPAALKSGGDAGTPSDEWPSLRWSPGLSFINPSPARHCGSSAKSGSCRFASTDVPGQKTRVGAIHCRLGGFRSQLARPPRPFSPMVRSNGAALLRSISSNRRQFSPQSASLEANGLGGFEIPSHSGRASATVTTSTYLLALRLQCFWYRDN